MIVGVIMLFIFVFLGGGMFKVIGILFFMFGIVSFSF